jgi:hypothetical protein
MLVSKEDAEKRRIDLAHRLVDACQSEVWRTVFLPYLEGEMRIEIENLTSHTDPLQLMRSAGAIQAVRRVIETEDTARRLVESKLNKKLSEFK